MLRGHRSRTEQSYVPTSGTCPLEHGENRFCHVFAVSKRMNRNLADAPTTMNVDPADAPVQVIAVYANSPDRFPPHDTSSAQGESGRVHAERPIQAARP